jgi:hypothetical protein
LMVGEWKKGGCTDDMLLSPPLLPNLEPKSRR